MKALIVDDEIHMKQAIELMLDGEVPEFEEIFYAANGKQALELIEEKRPEIMFCDMEMPVMGGRQLLEEIVARNIKIQVIAISGYNDFQYVHATLLANGVDYILKPFSKETLLRAVDKAVLRVKGAKEEASRTRIHEQMGMTMANQVLQQFCKGEEKEERRIREAFQKLGAKETPILLVSILSRNASQIIQERYDGDQELCFFTMGNILREMFRAYPFHQEIFIDEFNCQLFLQGDVSDPFRVADKMKICEKKLEDTLGIQTTWVVSRKAVKISQLEENLVGQNGILSQRGVWGCGLVGEPQGETMQDIPTVLSLELRILSVLEKKDKIRLQEIIHEYCMQLREHPIRLKQLQSCTADMNLLINRMISSQNMKIRIEPLSQWISDVEIWEREVLERLDRMMQQFEEQGDPADKIFSYIKEHYAENITLSSIAGDFYQTPQYVARIFKNKYDMTVVTAITQVRMEKACELLEEGTMSVARIAELVGYEDENYFGRIFKKQTGYTPVQYRKNRKI